MATDNNITYDTELTPQEKQEVQEALKSLSDEDVKADEDFIKNVYGQADNNMSEVYTENKKNKESILDKISKVLLYYTIIDSVLSLTKRQESHLYNSFSKTITGMFKDHIKLAQNVTENTLNKAFETINDKYNLKHSQKQREKLVNQKYFGKHFSERIWTDEQKVSKEIQLEMKNFLKGKVNANEIAKRIQLKFDTNEYNTKRLVDTELARIQNELFRQNCKKTGAKYVLYKATFCRTCKTCRAHHNITYKIDSAPLIPVHPQCRCFYTIIDNPLKTMNLQRFSNKSSKVNDESDIIKSGYKFDENGVIKITEDHKGEHYSPPRKYKPYAVIESDKVSNNGFNQIDRTIYDKDGMMIKQVHTSHHNRPKQHPYGKNGEHIHIYEWDKDGKLIRRVVKELADKDRREHKDILKE